MTSMKQVISLVAVIAFVVLSIASVSASAISSIEVNDVVVTDQNVAVAPGETVPVQIVFSTSDDAQDVRVKAWILGEQGYSASTGRFDTIADHTYTKTVSVQVPSNLDDLSEDLTLVVVVESKDGSVNLEESVTLGVQRDSYDVEVLDVDMDSQVKAGQNLALDIVLKNRGSHLAEDAFVVVTIPALGVEKKVYFGDLSALDQSDPEKEDALGKRINVMIPSSATTGVYAVEVHAYNGDFDSTVTRKVAVTGAGEETLVLSSVASKTIAANTAEEYSLTLVNTGSNVKVYNLVFETQNGLTFSVDEPVVVVPAGTSKTVKFDVTAAKAGTYNFAASVYSDGQFVKKVDFVANAEKNMNLAGNATVLLTVILAIVFVVLLVVLIVLLTRKPEKTEEFGESYY